MDGVKQDDHKSYLRTTIGYIREYYPESLYFDFDFVLVKNCETEKLALELEKEMQLKYELFGS